MQAWQPRRQFRLFCALRWASVKRSNIAQGYVISAPVLVFGPAHPQASTYWLKASCVQRCARPATFAAPSQLAAHPRRVWLVLDGGNAPGYATVAVAVIP